MNTYNIASKREVLWDMELADQSTNITLKMHKPTRKNISLVCDSPWEGESCCYGSILHDGEKYRLYYRGMGISHGYHGVWCVAYSYDGKNFTKPSLGIYEYNGSRDNNIIYMTDTHVDNFAVILDNKPGCPEDEKYKALSHFYVKESPEGAGHHALKYFRSSDGIRFTEVSILPIKGNFDSLNIGIWDADAGKYRLYSRASHTVDPAHKVDCEYEEHVRDVRLSFSDDYLNWSEPELLNYIDDPLEVQLYTNCIQKYHRADIFIGIPTRYINREIDAVNYKHLPDMRGKRPILMQRPETPSDRPSRAGTAITEAALMTSRDGINFRRTNEAFLTPGPENGDNWVYGDGYFAHGMIETESDYRGEPKELSIYVGKGYQVRPVEFERYTVRMDGFFSWSADFAGGEVLTKPISFAGGALSVNFETSALGYLQISICDADGNPIDGYSTGRLFGNSIDRPCDFGKPLSDLAGKPVRLRISMRDCEFYSFRFSE